MPRRPGVVSREGEAAGDGSISARGFETLSKGSTSNIPYRRIDRLTTHVGVTTPGALFRLDLPRVPRIPRL
jgi:hypothetical protein